MEDLTPEEKDEIEFLVAGLTEDEIKHYQALKDSSATTPESKKELLSKKIGMYKAIVEEMGYMHVQGASLKELNWLFQKTVVDFPKILNEKTRTIMMKMFTTPQDFYEKMGILDGEYNLRPEAKMTLQVVAFLIEEKQI